MILECWNVHATFKTSLKQYTMIWIENDWKNFKKKINKNWSANGKIQVKKYELKNGSINEYENGGSGVFETTAIQTDSEKILREWHVQKIPSKRFFGRWKISVGT